MAKPIYSDQDFQNTNRPINLPDPVNAQDGATKAYVDSAVEGLSWKDSVRVATAANINIAAPGASIDGVAMAANDRVLLMGETAGASNGIYVWNGAAVPMTRAQDMNSAAEVEQAITSVEEGTFAGASYRQTAVNVTLGTTTLAWTAFGNGAGAASEASAGIAEIATQAETDAATDDARMVTPLKLKTSPYAHRAFAANFGDAAATSFNIDHNLGTKDVMVEVVRNSDGATVLCDVARPTTNRVTIVAAPAPAANALRALITKVA